MAWEVHNGIVRVRPSSVKYYTSPRDKTTIRVLQRTAREGLVCTGRVQLSLSVSGYVKRWQKTGEIFEEVSLSMPDNVYRTRACWLDLPDSVAAEVRGLGLDLDAGLHAAAHAVLAMLPLRLSCESGDMGCECDALRHRTLWPKRLLLFDRGEGGSGVSERAAGKMMAVLEDALKLMIDCPCKDGCYCCVHMSKCPEYNGLSLIHI